MRKKCFFIMLLMTFILGLSNIALANEIFDEVPVFKHLLDELSSETKYYHIYSKNIFSSSNVNEYTLFIYGKEQKIKAAYNPNAFRGYYMELTGCAARQYSWKVGEPDWTLVSSLNPGATMNVGHPKNTDSISNNNNYFFENSNYDVYNGSELVFRQTPTLQRIFITTILKKDLIGVVSAITSLLALVGSLVVFLIGFRKAWNWLRTQLST